MVYVTSRGNLPRQRTGIFHSVNSDPLAPGPIGPPSFI